MIEVSEEVYQIIKSIELGVSPEEIEKQIQQLSLENLKLLSDWYTMPTDDKLLNVPLTRK